MVDRRRHALLVGKNAGRVPAVNPYCRNLVRDIIVFHAYNGKNESRRLHISTIDWTSDWPHAAFEAAILPLRRNSSR